MGSGGVQRGGRIPCKPYPPKPSHPAENDGLHALHEQQGSVPDCPEGGALEAAPPRERPRQLSQRQAPADEGHHQALRARRRARAGQLPGRVALVAARPKSATPACPDRAYHRCRAAVLAVGMLGSSDVRDSVRTYLLQRLNKSFIKQKPLRQIQWKLTTWPVAATCGVHMPSVKVEPGREPSITGFTMHTHTNIKPLVLTCALAVC
mmetsp:Transcript_37790/g.94919  ORF Transcript_37790/g.94919 Transcript_37790/m.94919 type:complete len:207 (+) Transcript_37790:1122-1742(+)